MTSKILKRLQSFAANQRGGVLVEGIIWIPVFLMVFLMVADASVMFMNHARVKKIVQDGGRQIAIGQIKDCQDLETWLKTNVSPLAPSTTASCMENYLGRPTVSLATVTVASDEIDLVGTSGFFGGMMFNISVVYNLEVG